MLNCNLKRKKKTLVRRVASPVDIHENHRLMKILLFLTWGWTKVLILLLWFYFVVTKTGRLGLGIDLVIPRRGKSVLSMHTFYSTCALTLCKSALSSVLPNAVLTCASWTWKPFLAKTSYPPSISFELSRTWKSGATAPLFTHGPAMISSMSSAGLRSRFPKFAIGPLCSLKKVTLVLPLVTDYLWPAKAPFFPDDPVRWLTASCRLAACLLDLPALCSVPVLLSREFLLSSNGLL